MKAQDKGFEVILWAIEQLKRHRRGHESVGRLQDALDGLGFTTKTGLKPLLAHEHKTAYGWHLVFHLPPGISSEDIIKKRRHLEEQAGGEIDFKLIDQNLHMDVSLIPLGNIVEYDPSEVPDERMHMPVPMGLSQKGKLVVDLANKPHMLVGGNTGSGKTTFLRVLTISLLKAGVHVVIIDLKGGLDFACFRNHCALVTSDRDALAVMKGLQKECQRRIPILEKAMVTSLKEYEGDDLPFVCLVIDEVAELETKESQQALNRLARLSRSAGISIVCATQRPSSSIFSSTVFSNTRMLFSGRLCFAVPRPEDSKMVLDDDAASRLPQDIPGRAIWQWERQHEVQCYNMSLKDAQSVLSTISVKGGLLHAQPAKKLAPRPQDA